MELTDVKYPINIREASELTGIAISTLSDVARRIGVGKQIGRARIRLLSKRDLEKILAAKREAPGRPKREA